MQDETITEHRYRYFRDPHRCSTYEEVPALYDICGETRLGYRGPFYGEVRIKFACEVCMIAGRLAEKEQETNPNDTLIISEQLRQLHPEWSDEHLLAEVEARFSELQTRTPHLLTWQGMDFPVHCGDFCCFLGYAGKPDYNAIAADGDGCAIFAASMASTVFGPGRIAETAEECWKDVLRDGRPKDADKAFSPEFCLFQCLVCRTYITEWDMD